MDRRVKAAAELLSLAPEGVEAVKAMVERDLDRAAAVGKPHKTDAIDAEVAKYRKILADLRNDPNLSHDQTEKIGLPALEQLRAVWQKRSVQVAAYEQKLDRAAVQLEGLAEFLRRLQAEAKDAGALPWDEYAQRIAALEAEISPAEKKEIRAVYAENAKLAAKLEPAVVSGLEALNGIRVMCGLRPLVYDLKLCETARGHSEDMQRLNFFAHDSPVPGKTTPWDRAKLCGTTANGENIYMGSSVTADAIKAWFLSPGHHKNMLNENFRRQGLAHAGKYWTQMFGD